MLTQKGLKFLSSLFALYSELSNMFVELFNCYKSNEILRPKIPDEFNLPKFTETKNIRIQDKTVLQKLQDFIEKNNITKK